MIPMTINWGEASSLAGKGFGTVFLVLIILAALTWLLGFAFQRAKRGKEKTNPAAKIEETKAKR